MKKTSTPSFVLELALVVQPEQARVMAVNKAKVRLGNLCDRPIVVLCPVIWLCTLGKW